MRLQDARRLFNTGRYRDALTLLNEGPLSPAERQESEALRVRLLERVGQHAGSRFLAEKLLKQRSTPASLRSDCRFSIGIIHLEVGNVESGQRELSAALELAREAGDATRAAWVRLRLMLLDCGAIPSEAAAQVISQTRAETRRLGDARLLAALHVYVGQIAIRHGALRTARRHTQLAFKLLDKEPDYWLRAMAENNCVALALIACDFETGLRHACAGLEAAEISGTASIKRACLGNLGNLYTLEGSWEKARRYFSESVSDLQQSGEYNNCIVESVARLHLLEGAVPEAHSCLDAIDADIKSDHQRLLYSHRHATLTRASALLEEGRLEEATSHADNALKLARLSGDGILGIMARLTKAEICLRQGLIEDFVLGLDDLSGDVPHMPIEMLGHYQRLVGLGSLTNDVSSAATHLRRVERLFTLLNHKPGQVILSRQMAGLDLTSKATSPAPPDSSCTARAVIQDCLSMLLHAGRPEVLAADLVEILASTGCVVRASAVARNEDGRIETIAAHSRTSNSGGVALSPARRYNIGRVGQRTIEVLCEPLQTVEAVATVNAVGSLLQVVRDLDAARQEREERLGLWPIEELPDNEEDAVIVGSMREVMRLARKVASTSATVLITGESGTGKEIVARAIHRWGTKPGQPYIPFNCTAVPKDLLESHLFGYRRGAFTGAERDHPGVIRSAKEGTLFLDEIGELGLEAQPKLLRFLESQEVHPLGETEPVRVKARVVAATNANLETLVREGRFRSDLFYRLRVVPIGIPPLRERRDEIQDLALHFVARAAQDFGKGQVKVDDETLELLTLQDWPGNVRQLNNELRSIVAMADADITLTADMLPTDFRRGHRTGTGEDLLSISTNDTLASALARVERQMIAAALKTHRGKLDATAKALGISRKGLYLKRLRLGL